MNGHDFRDIVSGARQDLLARIARPFLTGLELPFSCLVASRNYAYDHRWLSQRVAAVPVVSIGNLTLGGTGKTPLVTWVAQWFQQQGFRPAILSRGYRAGPDGSNDEAREIALNLPQVPHLQQKNRSQAAVTAVRSFQANVILLDDGFQHRQLARNLDIVIIDAMCPWGFGRIFPRGMLRESSHALQRAHVYCLSRADAIDSATRSTLRRAAIDCGGDKPWVEIVHRPSCLIDVHHNVTPLASLAGESVVAFCGIGNPAGFRHTLQTLGCKTIGWREFPDHHHYDDSSIQDLERWIAQFPSTSQVLCTHKDLVKFSTDTLSGLPLRAVAIDCHFLQGQAILETQLRSIVQKLS
ncbi:MAG: tetraacyldisaccharide 4'-kinase [Planctomycetota bacterium]|nr:tetraacyldisaccharide 4'-kinase [Planctomycetota bacterium]MDA1179705.1 tetraacyldisaccharide 4'-kinase [Planctomycetota bacterium]